MDVATLTGFLFGSEEAIREAAHSPWSVGVGLVFVLTAGIARGYRKHDLCRRPGYLVLPLAASAATALLLYLLVSTVMLLGGAAPVDRSSGPTTFLGGWLLGYVSLLGLFWMTAPLAWLYGIPFERWADRAGAVQLRLWCLGLVSLWRVALMVRVLVVLLDCPPGAAFFVVTLFGDAVAVAALWATESKDTDDAPQLLSAMGGIGPTAPAEVRLLRAVRGWVLGLGVLTGPVWLIGTLHASESAASWSALPQVHFGGPSPSTGLVALALGSLAVWCLALIPAQRRQRLRSRVETLAAGGQLDAALAEMSRHSPADFPDHWRPPPAGDFRRDPSRRLLLDMVERTSAGPSAPWVRAAYREQFGKYLDEALWYWFDEATFTRVAGLLGRYPEGPELAARTAAAIDRLFKVALFSFPVREEEGMRPPPFPVSEDDLGRDVLSDPEWPRDSRERREALQAIRTLAARARADGRP